MTYPNLTKRLVSVALVSALTLAAAGCGGKSGAPAAGADKGNAAGASVELKTIQDVAQYEGADRTDRIVAAAKKEGSLNLYTSIAQTDTDVIVSDFEKKYGIKVTVWRASTDEVLQRSVQEAKAGKNNFDVVHISSPQMEALHREKLLQPVKSPYTNDLIDGSTPAHKEWTSTLLSVFVQAYNTNKVKKEELPKTYEELLNPKWKGMLGIEASDQDWFGMNVKRMGGDKGLQYFKDLASTTNLSVRKGHSLLNNLVVSGEVPMGLTVYNYMPEQAKQKGAPIDWFVIEPALARANGIGVSVKAAHPNAAMLFYDYMISDAQKLLLDLNYVPTSKKIDSPLKNIKIDIMDAATSLDEMDNWTKQFDSAIVKRK
ncbi:extracellular solute-binding protein [Paenibacillus thalictri]|uniref:Extracellular solute-binding protein n=1 Tax=Paenibacillus thalictri TaxID=2527873 RepID=A0A4Q9DYP2_9BACL|nr:extracellular solute-binding protein [Paenibacillus thalictri]TBL81230.1 extracellular solute-binding protein [Paenibacillus thalictri]